jgi:hypothetical protein
MGTPPERWAPYAACSIGCRRARARLMSAMRACFCGIREAGTRPVQGRLSGLGAVPCPHDSKQGVAQHEHHRHPGPFRPTQSATPPPRRSRHYARRLYAYILRHSSAIPARAV